MTEQEWLACEDAWLMVQFLRKLGTDRRLVSPLAGGAMLRKIQLFACAACRLGWDGLDDPRWRQAVEVAERHADGLAKKAELQKARHGAETANRDCTWDDKPARSLSVDATKVAGEWAWNVLDRARWVAPLPLFRCVFGNPFRTAILASEWLTPTVVSLGLAAYEERELPSGAIDPQRLAVLSDALEEAGCTDGVVLEHLRSPGPHVRGCWALDQIVGRQAALS